MTSNDVMDAAARRMVMGGCEVGPMIDRPVDGGIALKAECKVCGEWREVVVFTDRQGRASTASLLPKCPGPKAEEPKVPSAPTKNDELPPVPTDHVAPPPSIVDEPLVTPSTPVSLRKPPTRR